jgi:hypothetical protein
MNVYLVGVLWVAAAAALGAAIGYLVRRIGTEKEGRQDNNAAAGQVFTVVAGLYAVLLAFVLIGLFDSNGAAGDGTYTEADSLVAASWAADALPPEAKAKVHQLAVSYANTVKQQEWPRMIDGGPVPDTGWTQLNQMRQAVAGADAGSDSWVADRKTEASNQLWSVYQARQNRLKLADSSGVGSVVWFLLILGALITALLLPNLFGGTRPRTHVLIMATFTGTIALLLFVIFELQNPFTGGAPVGPDAFTSALERLG